MSGSYRGPLRGLKVGVDLDGIGYGFVLAFYEWAKRSPLVTRLGLPVPPKYPEPQTWNFFEDWGWTLEQYLKIAQEGVEAGYIFAQGEPLPGYALGLRRLEAAGAEVSIVTNRNFGSIETMFAITYGWLIRYHVPHKQLIATHDKPAAYRAANIEIGIDDSPHEVTALTAAGFRCIALRYPYNAHLKAEFVDSFDGFVSLVLRDYRR